MTRLLVITLIGNDRPGLVEKISSLITEHDGNWLESSLINLAGKFAGVVKISVPTEKAETLQQALTSLTDLRVTVEAGDVESPIPAQSQRRLTFSLVGHDRIGIVREVSQVFARYGVNVEKFSSYTSSAPMSSETLFHAEAELLATNGLDSDTLKSELELLSNELIVDIDLDDQA